MLHKRNRLRKRREFALVRNRGRSWASPLMVLYAYRRRGGGLRAGFSVSKRVGKATVRNRVKRLMREALRATLGQVRPGYDLVLIARPPAAHAGYAEMSETLDQLLRRAGLYQNVTRHA